MIGGSLSPAGAQRLCLGRVCIPAPLSSKTGGVLKVVLVIAVIIYVYQRGAFASEQTACDSEFHDVWVFQIEIPGQIPKR